MIRRKLTPDYLETLKERAMQMSEKYKKLNIMSAITCIIELAEDSNLCDEFFRVADRYLAYLAARQGITKNQALMLALMVEHGTESHHTDYADLARFLSCSRVSLLQYQKDMDVLIRKGLVQLCETRYDGSFYFEINDLVVEAFAEDKPYEQPSYKGLTIQKWFRQFYNLTHLRYKKRMSTEFLLNEFERLLSENETLPFVQELERLKLEPMDKLVLATICRNIIINKRDCVSFENLNYLYDDDMEQSMFVDSLQNDTHALLKRKLVEHAVADGFESTEEFRVTDKARKHLLKGLSYKISTEGSMDMKRCTDIVAKKLYFSSSVQEQLTRLSDLLNEKNYQRICERLQKKGLREGFACLFYGSPGTGKTETVLQLARESGRDIMQVNISEIKSKWVGDSEKNIKAIFDQYRSMSRYSKRMPILLFNEADAVIGIRKEGADGAVEKMENAIQNIILQEMETFKGILIATTNLEQNMDHAFERRFLFKVRFEKPEKEQRQLIWQSIMPSLNDEISGRLAERFDFSGGQIENIARKADIDSILYGEESVSGEKVEQFCLEEILGGKTMRRIGFC